MLSYQLRGYKDAFITKAFINFQMSTNCCLSKNLQQIFT